MELEMIAFTTTETPDRDVDFWRPMVVNKLHQWRDHTDLHSWMKQLYRSKGGAFGAFEAFEAFKLTPVALTGNDLDELEEAVLMMGLSPESDGCNVGDGCDEAQDLEFVEKARAVIGEGKTVFCVAWGEAAD